MKMKLFVFSLVKFLFDLSTVTAQGDQKCAGSSQQPILCQFKGKAQDISYKFNIADVSNECNIIVFSYYFFDGDGGSNFVPEDEGSIKTLVENKRVVYTVIGFMHEDLWWNEFFPPDQEEYAVMRDKLVTFLAASNISGIILDTPKLYNGPANLEEKIDSFVKDIKSFVKDLKVGIIIDGVWFDKFGDKDLFDYSLINNNMDLFIIDTTKANECNAETKKTGVVPIKSEDSKIITLEKITDAVLQSTMDKCRIYGRMEISVRMPKNNEGISVPRHYSEYCTDGSEVKTQGCAQTSTMLFEKGKHMKDVLFQGIMLSYMEDADFSNACGCGPFSAKNKIIEGWQNQPLEKCEKMDAP